MRAIEWTSQFKHDYKRECKSKHGATLEVDLFSIVDFLANNQPRSKYLESHVSAFFAGKRALSKTEAIKLGNYFAIDPAALLPGLLKKAS